MSDEGTSVSSVGVVGTAGRDAVLDALNHTGLTAKTRKRGEGLQKSVDVLVGLGEGALLELVRNRPAIPIVPIAAGSGVRSVPQSEVRTAITELATGEWDTETHTMLAIETGNERYRALFDTMVVTEQPAHISEFSVVADGEHVGRFRADGVLAATPAGTPDYSRAADGPVIPPGPDVAALTPVAPFATDLDHWVVPLGAVEITVERENAAVELLVDDRRVGTVSVDQPLCLSADGTVDIVRLSAGVSPFGR